MFLVREDCFKTYWDQNSLNKKAHIIVSPEWLSSTCFQIFGVQFVFKAFARISIIISSFLAIPILQFFYEKKDFWFTVLKRVGIANRLLTSSSASSNKQIRNHSRSDECLPKKYSEFCSRKQTWIWNFVWPQVLRRNWRLNLDHEILTRAKRILLFLSLNNPGFRLWLQITQHHGHSMNCQRGKFIWLYIPAT